MQNAEGLTPQQISEFLKGSQGIQFRATIHNTPPERRSEFAREIWHLRRGRGTDRRGVPF